MLAMIVRGRGDQQEWVNAGYKGRAGALVLGAIRMWDRLVSGRVIEKLGHAEVDSTSGIQPPSRDVMQNLF